MSVTKTKRRRTKSKRPSKTAELRTAAQVRAAARRRRVNDKRQAVRNIRHDTRRATKYWDEPARAALLQFDLLVDEIRDENRRKGAYLGPIDRKEAAEIRDVIRTCYKAGFLVDPTRLLVRNYRWASTSPMSVRAAHTWACLQHDASDAWKGITFRKIEKYIPKWTKGVAGPEAVKAVAAMLDLWRTAQ